MFLHHQVSTLGQYAVCLVFVSSMRLCVTYKSEMSSPPCLSFVQTLPLPGTEAVCGADSTWKFHMSHMMSGEKHCQLEHTLVLVFKSFPQAIG